MYRAAQAAGIDWRFFTSQVASDQFEVAFRGVQALGLDGVALLEPFQSEAIPLLDSVTETALALGKVNVARSDGNSWLGDNTLGIAIAKLIESRSSLQGIWERNDPNLEQSPNEVGIAPKAESQITVVDAPAIAKAIQLASASLALRV
jgi:hypothetical protein